jgi:hypothetical protein
MKTLQKQKKHEDHRIESAFDLCSQLTRIEVRLAQGATAKLLATHLAQDAATEAEITTSQTYVAPCGRESNAHENRARKVRVRQDVAANLNA